MCSPGCYIILCVHMEGKALNSIDKEIVYLMFVSAERMQHTLLALSCLSISVTLSQKSNVFVIACKRFGDYNLSL